MHTTHQDTHACTLTCASSQPHHKIPPYSATCTRTYMIYTQLQHTYTCIHSFAHLFLAGGELGAFIVSLTDEEIAELQGIHTLLQLCVVCVCVCGGGAGSGGVHVCVVHMGLWCLIMHNFYFCEYRKLLAAC